MLARAANRLVIRLGAVAIACWLAGGATHVLVSALFGGRPVDMHVRWSATTTDAERVGLERRFHLLDGTFREQRTYAYTLADVSRANIEALVNDDAVEDTTNIDRTTLQPLPGIDRRPWATARPWVPTGLEVLTSLLVLAGAVAGAAAVVELWQQSSGTPSSLTRGYRFLHDAAARVGPAPFIFALVALTFVLGSMSGHEEYSDEGCHFRQVGVVWQHRWETAPCLTTMPGYHIAVASVIRGLNLPATIDAVRMVTAVASAVMFGLFALCAVVIGSRPALKTTQLIALPILLLYTGLVYTDAMALLGLVLASLFALRGRNVGAAISLALTLFVRQTHIVWGALLVGMCWQAVGLWPETVAGWTDRDAWLRRARCVWPFVIPLLVFAVFVVWNRGIAVGDAEAHHAGLYPGNAIFASLLLAIFFAPQALASAWRQRGSPSAWLLAVICMVLVASRFEVTHPYNQLPEIDFLRNRVILWFASGAGPRVLLSLGVALGVVGILGARVRLKWLLLLTAALSMVPFELIEQRYAIPAFAFFILLREPEERWQEWLSVALMSCLTAFFVHGVSEQIFKL